MTVADISTPTGQPEPAVPSQIRRTLRVEPMIELEWSQAIEPHIALASATTAVLPSETRRAWVHRAPEDQVIALYRSVSAADPQLAAPWWLKALANGELSSRAEGFLLEDRVGKLLNTRPGWVFVPWSIDGDCGYWEYMPSERRVPGPAVPTTLVLTSRHRGWLDIYPVHLTSAKAPAPLAVGGMGDLRSNLARWESVF